MNNGIFGKLFGRKEVKMENTYDVRSESSTSGDTTVSMARIYNLIIVDESGSMGHLTKATLSGINETISTIRSAFILWQTEPYVL